MDNCAGCGFSHFTSLFQFINSQRRAGLMKDRIVIFEIFSTARKYIIMKADYIHLCISRTLIFCPHGFAWLIKHLCRDEPCSESDFELVLPLPFLNLAIVNALFIDFAFRVQEKSGNKWGKSMFPSLMQIDKRKMSVISVTSFNQRNVNHLGR